MQQSWFGSLISATRPTPNASSAIGVWNLTDQYQAKNNGNWPTWGGNTVSISPTFSGQNIWNFDTDGALNITTGSYTITPNKTFTVTLKMWGMGGYNDTSGSGGAGGALVANLIFTNGQAIYVTFAGGGIGGQSGTPGNGGNYAGIFLGNAAVHANAIAIAGGGGGSSFDDGARGATGGAGGYPTGQTSTGWNSSALGYGGTQSAGGTGGGGSGSALQGANVNPSGYVGGGGGGGYYGGGGGGMVCCYAGGGGGGGSNYNSANTSLISGVTHYSGNYTTPGNSSDANRGGAGASNGGTPRIYMTL